MVFRWGPNPHGVSAPFEQLPGLGIRNDEPPVAITIGFFVAAASEERHMPGACNRLRRAAKELLQRQLGLLFDQRIEFQERSAEIFGQGFPDCGFSRAA